MYLTIREAVKKFSAQSDVEDVITFLTDDGGYWFDDMCQTPDYGVGDYADGWVISDELAPSMINTFELWYAEQGDAFQSGDHDYEIHSGDETDIGTFDVSLVVTSFLPDNRGEVAEIVDKTMKKLMKKLQTLEDLD